VSDAAEHIELETDNRLRRVRVAPPVLFFMLQDNPNAWFQPAENRLPKDARLVNAYFDADRNMFYLVVEHESFEPVGEGQVIPEHPGVGIEWEFA
jgi:hypothetical protein